MSGSSRGFAVPWVPHLGERVGPFAEHVSTREQRLVHSILYAVRRFMVVSFTGLLQSRPFIFTSLNTGYRVYRDEKFQCSKIPMYLFFTTHNYLFSIKMKVIKMHEI